MKERNKGVATNHIFYEDEAGRIPDIKNHFNLTQPKIDVLTGSAGKFIWDNKRIGADTYKTTTETKKYERRKLSKLIGNSIKS
jgi:hypothetical protein